MNPPFAILLHRLRDQGRSWGPRSSALVPPPSGPASRKSCAGINRSFRARGVGALRQAGTLSARANSNAEKLKALALF
ncbi:hypothetical protein C6341_g26416 [Phytophthora cactorum]|nr:hypothetical protein C6341_g26416 [Phytophthora cactorum]